MPCAVATRPTKRRIQLGWRTGGEGEGVRISDRWRELGRFHGIAVPNCCSWQAMTLQSNINVQWKKAAWKIERRTWYPLPLQQVETVKMANPEHTFIYKRCSSVGSGEEGGIFRTFPPDW